MDVKKQNIGSQLAAVNAATAQILNLTSAPEMEMDTPAVSAAVATITSNIPEMSRDVKIVAALMQDEKKSNELIDAARRLCKALSDLLNGAKPTGPAPRPQMLQSASKVGDASQAVISTIAEPETEYDKETADILLAIAKHVANAAAALVLKAKDVASECEDESLTGKFSFDHKFVLLAVLLSENPPKIAEKGFPTFEMSEVRRPQFKRPKSLDLRN